jgi:hypothetical protein
MAFRSDSREESLPLPGQSPAPRRRAHPDEDDAGSSLSLSDTLRELAVTIVGFVGVIVLIIAIVDAFHG